MGQKRKGGNKTDEEGKDINKTHFGNKLKVENLLFPFRFSLLKEVLIKEFASHTRREKCIISETHYSSSFCGTCQTI